MRHVITVIFMSLMGCSPIGTVSLAFDTNDLPVEVAFQDGDGPWQLVSLVDGVAEALVTDPRGRYGVAFTGTEGTGLFHRTLWEQSRWDHRRRPVTHTWHDAEQTARPFTLEDLTPGAHYRAWVGHASTTFVARASSQRVGLVGDSFEGPLVIVDTTNDAPRLFVIPVASEDQPTRIGPGVPLVDVPPLLTGIPPSTPVSTVTRCVVQSEGGTTLFELPADQSTWSLRRPLMAPEGAARCEFGVSATRGGWTQRTTVEPGTTVAVPALPEPRIDDSLAFVSWPDGSLDDDSAFSAGKRGLDVWVSAGWRFGATTYSLGDTRATPALEAARRTPGRPSLSAMSGRWGLWWSGER